MIDLSVVVPADGEHDVLPALARLARAVAALGATSEILVASTAPVTPLPNGARAVQAARPGFGAALAAGFAAARGAWVLTIDADVLEPGRVIADLWWQRHEADVSIASRYVPGGEAHMPEWRRRGSGGRGGRRGRRRLRGFRLREVEVFHRILGAVLRRSVFLSLWPNPPRIDVRRVSGKGIRRWFRAPPPP